MSSCDPTSGGLVLVDALVVALVPVVEAAAVVVAASAAVVVAASAAVVLVAFSVSVVELVITMSGPSMDIGTSDEDPASAVDSAGVSAAPSGADRKDSLES